jgi:hypothetical protein
MKRWLAFLGTLLFAGAAQAAPTATCTFNTGSWTWTAMGAITEASPFDGTGSCVGDGSADDLFVIPDGATVTITGDITFDGTTTGTGITVESGGTLTASTSETNQQITLTLPIGIAGVMTSSRHTDGVGLNCEPGSTCTLTGAYRSTAVADVTLQSSIGTNIWYVGDIVPCPDGNEEPDCLEADPETSGTAGDAEIIQFSYTDAKWNDSSGASGIRDREWDTLIGDIAATDIIFAYDSDVTDQFVGAEVGNAYEISATDSSFTAAIEIDVRQTNEASPLTHHGFPLTGARSRVLEEGTLNAALGAGGRQITSAAGMSVDYEWNGAWLYIEDPNRQEFPYPKPWRLSRSMDEAGGGTTNDTFDIYDPRGIPFDVASGEQFWVSRVGFETGDEFVVIAPLRIVSATAAATDQTDSVVYLGGTHTVEGVVFDAIGYVEVAYPPTTWQMNVIRDHSPDDTEGGQALYLTGTETGLFDIGWTNLTGGSITQANDTDYGFRSNVPNAYFHDSAIKYAADDVMLNNSTSSVPLGTRIERINAAYHSANEDSGNVWDATSDSSAVQFLNSVSCADCVSTNLWASDPTSQNCTVNDLMYIGGNRGRFPTMSNNGCRFTNYASYGGGEAESSIGSSFSMVPSNTQFFAVDDYIGDLTSGNERLADTSAVSIQNGVWRTVVLNDAQVVPFESNTGAYYYNLGMLDVYYDPAGSGNLDLLHMNDNTSRNNFTMRYFSHVSRLGLDQTANRRLFQSNSNGMTSTTIEGVLIDGWGTSDSTNSLPWVSGIATATVADDKPFCFSNTFNPPSEGFSAFPTATVIDIAPRYKDLPGGDISPQKTFMEGSKQCGILGGRNGPGIRYRTWTHSLNKIEPVFMGDRNSNRQGHGQ